MRHEHQPHAEALDKGDADANGRRRSSGVQPVISHSDQSSRIAPHGHEQARIHLSWRGGPANIMATMRAEATRHHQKPGLR